MSVDTKTSATDATAVAAASPDGDRLEKAPAQLGNGWSPTAWSIANFSGHGWRTIRPAWRTESEPAAMSRPRYGRRYGAKTVASLLRRALIDTGGGFTTDDATR